MNDDLQLELAKNFSYARLAQQEFKLNEDVPSSPYVAITLHTYRVGNLNRSLNIINKDL